MGYQRTITADLDAWIYGILYNVEYTAEVEDGEVTILKASRTGVYKFNEDDSSEFRKYSHPIPLSPLELSKVEDEIHESAFFRSDIDEAEQRQAERDRNYDELRDMEAAHEYEKRENQ